MERIVGAIALLIGTSAVAMALSTDGSLSAPEIDARSGMTALALLSGGLLLLRTRRKQ